LFANYSRKEVFQKLTESKDDLGIEKRKLAGYMRGTAAHPYSSSSRIRAGRLSFDTYACIYFSKGV
jgi:hypothetical protein